MGMKKKIVLGAAVGFVVIAAVSANSGDGDKSDGKSSYASADRKAGSDDAKSGSGGDKSEKREVAFSGDGTFEVGKDVKPGTYRTTGNTDGMCYWERAKDASGEMDSLIANDNVTGTSYVTVVAGDKLFKSTDCEDWEAVDEKAKGTGSPATSAKGDGGMYRVGVDLAPGTYKSTGNTDGMCYWERAKDAQHSLNSIRANDNVTGSGIVTISADDAYFKTTGCKDWKKTA
ncbi:hypothetical protein [Streptomyces sp. NPDC059786]|uniref:hypothetical protein n=1 Tax=Streptomyces sp. NPDC059786 TaxID=3346946 RepID=UPI00364DB18C